MRANDYAWSAAASKLGYRRSSSFIITLLIAALMACAGASSAFALSPSVETKPAVGVGDTSATLVGFVNPNGLETKAYFEYGLTTSYGSKTTEASVGSGTTAVEFTQTPKALTPNTTYHYRVVATNSSGTSQGNDTTFTTTAHAPGVSTSPAEPEATGEAAVLKGTVDPNGQSTTYQFECGTASGVYTITAPIPAASAGSEDESQSVSYTLGSLTRGTKYFCRITATNATGKSNGSEISFVTPNAPAAITAEGGEITGTCATLYGFVEPHNLATKYWFEYGTTTSYGSKIPVTAKELSAGTSFKFVEERLCGLKGTTLYHFRLVAQNEIGTTNGADSAFTTLPAVTLSVKGTPLASKSPLSSTGSSLTFISNTSKVHTCQEVELSGTVTENPGALQSMPTLKMQNSGGAPCPYVETGLTVKYSVLSETRTVEFAIDKSEQGIVKVSKFTLIGTIFSGATNVGTCEYSAELSGTYAFGKPLQWTLSGKLTLVKQTGLFCFSSETLSGTLAVTSAGSVVEATH